MSNADPTAQPLLTRKVPHPTKCADSTIINHADNYWTMRNNLIRISIMVSGIGLLASAASIVLAIVALNSSIRNQRDLKGIDLIASFQKRYDELLYDERSKISTPQQSVDTDNSSSMSDSKRLKAATDWYHRFWDLQFEQYQYWKLGYINNDIYSSWMDFRHHEFKNAEPLAGISYEDGWKETKLKHFGGAPDRDAYYGLFKQFMDNVFNGRTEVYKNGPQVANSWWLQSSNSHD